MSEFERALAFLEGLTEYQISSETRAVRRRLALACRRAAEIAEPEIEQPKSGVLYDLKNGGRHW